MQGITVKRETAARVGGAEYAVLSPAGQHEASRQLVVDILLQLCLGYAIRIVMRQTAKNVRHHDTQRPNSVCLRETLRVEPPYAEPRIPEGEQVPPLRVKDHVPDTLHVRIVEHDDAFVQLAHVKQAKRTVAVAQEDRVRIRPSVRVKAHSSGLPSEACLYS